MPPKRNELSEAERLAAARRAMRVNGMRLLAEPARAESRATRAAPNGEEFDHRFLASTELLASDGAVILLDGWQVEKFMRRPRWIACHDIFGFSGPINRIALGRVVWVGLEEGLDVAMAGPSGRGLVAYVRYASTPFAQEVKTLYDEGGLDDVSVRWDPFTEIRRPATLDERKVYGEQCDWIIESAELIELSSVLLGADSGAQQMRGEVRSAVARCRAAGHTLPILEAMTMRAEDDEDEDEPAAPAEPVAETADAPADAPADKPADAPADKPATEPAAETDEAKPEETTKADEPATDEPAVVAQPDEAALRSAVDALGEVVTAARQGFSAFGDVLVQMEQRMTEIRNLFASAEAIADEAAATDEPRGAQAAHAAGGAVTLDDLEDLRAEVTLLHRAVTSAAKAVATRHEPAPTDQTTDHAGFVFDLAKLRNRERPGNRATA